MRIYKSILSREGIPYKLSGDLTVTVLDVNRSSAKLTLGANNIRCATYISDNDFQVEIKLKEDIISCFDEIKNANVNIYTLSNEETCISILLELQSDLSPEMIDYLAAAVSGAMGSNNADNILIADIDGTILYLGDSYKD